MTPTILPRRQSACWTGSKERIGHVIGGEPGDIAVSGDYDGDHRNDFVVFRSANASWMTISSSDAEKKLVEMTWGKPGDLPVEGDFDGDGRADLATFTEATGTFNVRRSRDGAVITKSLGSPGFRPLNAPASVLAATKPRPI